MAVDDFGDHVGEIGVWIDAIKLQVSISEAMTAQCSPPPSEPANSAFFRFNAIGLMLRSTTLESISMRPSSRKRIRPFQRESAYKGLEPTGNRA